MKNLEIALETLWNSALKDWSEQKLKRIVGEKETGNIITEEVAELVAAGLLLDVLPSLTVVPKKKNKKTPDFSNADGSCFFEVYCPLESTTEQEKIETSLKGNGESTLVRVVITQPLTGSNPNQKKYSTNEIITRVVSEKRKKDQTVDGEMNILWLDLANGFQAVSRNMLPLKSIYHKSQTTVGCFGIWHAFYGLDNNGAKIPSERASLKYQNHHYFQQKNGLFRERGSLSAALILTLDGVILFENPWAIKRLSGDLRKSLTFLQKFRPEFSFFGYGEKGLNEREVEEEIAKINWLLT